MLIIGKEFIDCLTAIYALPEAEKREWEAKLGQPHLLFPAFPMVGRLPAAGNQAFAKLETLLSTLPEASKANIPAYSTDEDKLRVLEFAWLWWEGVRHDLPDKVNLGTTVYPAFSPSGCDCTRTLISVIVDRNHPALLQLAIEKFGKSLVVGITSTQQYQPFAHLHHILTYYHTDLIWKDIFQIFAQAIAEDKIIITTDILVVLLKIARKVKQKSLTNALLTRATRPTDDDQYCQKEVLQLVRQVFHSRNTELINTFVGNWHACLKKLASDPTTVFVYVDLALGANCQRLLDIALESLRQHQFMIDFPSIIFAMAYGMGGMELVNQLKTYHGDQEELYVLSRPAGGLPIYSSRYNPDHTDVGYGTYSKVWSAVLQGNNQTKSPVAIKSFKPRDDHKEMEWQRKEVNIFLRLGDSCENVIKLHGFYGEPFQPGQLLRVASPLGLVLEYAFFGDLLNFRRFLKNSPQALLNKIALDVSRALAHCHANLVVHNDLKPENVLVRLNADGTFSFCLTDFGLSYVIDPTKLDEHFLAGSVHYQSPEKILDQLIDPVDAPKVDVWAYACILYFLIYVQHPWTPELESVLKVTPKKTGYGSCDSDVDLETIRILAAFIDQGKLPAIPEDKPCDGVLSIASVMHACFFKDPKQRISSQELVDKLATPHHFQKA